MAIGGEFEDIKIARFVPISRIQSTQDNFIRTVGYSKGLDLASELLTLEYGGHHVLVNIHYIYPFEFVPGTILQIIGSLERKRKREVSEVVLKAELYRNMNGLDVDLYHKTQELRKRSH